MWQSRALSKCLACPKLYEQWCVNAWAVMPGARCVGIVDSPTLTLPIPSYHSGGYDPGTSNKWSKPTCCPGGAYCKWVNNGYSQCVKNGS